MREQRQITIQCSGCKRPYIMPKDFMGSILCEACDPKMNPMTQKDMITIRKAYDILNKKMREIKFRMWHISKREMIQPEFINNLEGETSFHLDQDLVLMQFTGLQDNSGKDIYEHDILNCKVNLFDASQGRHSRVVVFKDGKFSCGDTDIIILLSGVNNFDPQVHGNIYENPDLLQ